jgi:hypothetical protein
MPMANEPQAPVTSASPGARSSLSLDGSGHPGSGRLDDGAAARDMLAEGAVRARNMAHALGMIVLLVGKYVATKIVWARLQTFGMRTFLLTMRLTQAAYVLAKPHYERLKAQALETTNTVWRLVLVKLIQVLGPLEEALLKLFGIAKVEAGKLAARSTRSVAQVLKALGAAIVQAARAGMTKPAIHKAVTKIIQVLEDAHL